MTFFLISQKLLWQLKFEKLFQSTTTTAAVTTTSTSTLINPTAPGYDIPIPENPLTLPTRTIVDDIEDRETITDSPLTTPSVTEIGNFRDIA